MTTIAYKDGVIAYDSRRMVGDDTIFSDNAQKMVLVDGERYFVAGSPSDINDFIHAYKTGARTRDGASISALIFDGKDLFSAGIYNSLVWTLKHDGSEFIAIGSGRHNAYTAMDMGADAKTAVKMAAKRDSCTGGKIRTFKL